MDDVSVFIQLANQWTWIGWLVLIAIFLVIEMLTLDFTFLMLALGSAIGLIVDLVGAPLWVQVLVAALAAGVFILTLRPPLLKRLRHGEDPTKSNVDALIGLRGTVLQEITTISWQVKLANGDTWTARSESITTIPAGCRRGRRCHQRRRGTGPTARQVVPARGVSTVSDSSFIPTAIGWILAIAVIILVVVTVVRSIRIIPQATAGIVERLGRYHKTLTPGLNILVPFIDRLRPLIDMREQVVSFPPQPVITEDNLVVSIDTVVYFQVTDARAATYEIANCLGAVEQLTTTTRSATSSVTSTSKRRSPVVTTSTSRDNINGQLRVVLDEATGKWGIRVSRVELKAIDPSLSIQDSMEKQMRAERDRRAAILKAEGSKQSQILEAEGQRQAAILKAEGEKQAAVQRAQGEAVAIQNVFASIHQGRPDDKLLAYQYPQMLPKISESESSKLWIIPSELTEALKGIAVAFTPKAGPDGTPPPAT